MSRMVIMVGDLTSGGGAVITGSPFTDIDGKPVARINDKATCSKHKGVFPIVSGDATYIIDGQPVARHGDYLACGCRLMSVRQFRVFLDEGTSDNLAADEAMYKAATAAAATAINTVAGKFDDAFILVSQKTGTPLKQRHYKVIHANGAVETGTTDDQGMTHLVKSDVAEQLSIELQEEGP